MTDKNLLSDIEKAKKKQSFPMLGLVVAILSIVYGEFVIRVDGWFLARTEPYFQMIPEDVVGAVLLILGILKLLGIFTKNRKTKRVGIIGLSATWAALATSSFLYSFGTGHPHASWQFMAFVAAICVIESHQGRYAD